MDKAQLVRRNRCRSHDTYEHEVPAFGAKLEASPEDKRLFRSQILLDLRQRLIDCSMKKRQQRENR